MFGINFIISPHLGVFLGIIRVWTGRKQQWEYSYQHPCKIAILILKCRALAT